jgi:hypothetical protein
MRDVQLHRARLGLTAPWTVAGVDVDLKGQRVVVRVEGGPGPYLCPECATPGPRRRFGGHGAAPGRHMAGPPRSGLPETPSCPHSQRRRAPGLGAGPRPARCGSGRGRFATSAEMARRPARPRLAGAGGREPNSPAGRPDTRRAGSRRRWPPTGSPLPGSSPASPGPRSTGGPHPPSAVPSWGGRVVHDPRRHRPMPRQGLQDPLPRHPQDGNRVPRGLGNEVVHRLVPGADMPGVHSFTSLVPPPPQQLVHFLLQHPLQQALHPVPSEGLQALPGQP